MGLSLRDDGEEREDKMMEWSANPGIVLARHKGYPWFWLLAMPARLTPNWLATKVRPGLCRR